MPKKDGPNVRQRRVARVIRRWRTDRKLTQEDVAKRLRWSDAKVSRIERADAVVGPAEIIALAVVLGVGDDERDEVVRWAISATAGQDLLGSFGPESLRGNFKDFVETEADASEVRTVETVLVTGLLQTEGYADALLGVARRGVAQDVITERRALRLRRQARLDEIGSPLRLHAILHEPSLHLPIGGAAVMADQLDHLIRRGKQDNVTVRILPSSLGEFSGIGAAYHLMSFTDDAPGAAYEEGIENGTYVEDEAELAVYSSHFDRLTDIALNPEASARLIAEIASTWKQRS
ncbi:helix-turn-helix domain-containing protein [Actinokineospora guangxiensis]|uniref:Helix-turn-helix domain-containing protein n=1 Tax=Actinokineospora guangxiensis TaxID=1490288 RepID=A0ABW0EJD2_9PSEU